MLNIKRLREEKNLTQGKLAELIGVTTRTIQHWEKGEKNITIDKLNKIHEIFNEKTNCFSFDSNAKNEDEGKSRETLLNELQLKDEIISLYKEQIEFLKKQLIEKLDKFPINEIHEIHELTSRSALIDFLKSKTESKKFGI